MSRARSNGNAFNRLTKCSCVLDILFTGQARTQARVHDPWTLISFQPFYVILLSEPFRSWFLQSMPMRPMPTPKTVIQLSRDRVHGQWSNRADVRSLFAISAYKWTINEAMQFQCVILANGSRWIIGLHSSGFFDEDDKIAVVQKLGHSQAIIQDASEFNALFCSAALFSLKNMLRECESKAKASALRW